MCSVCGDFAERLEAGNVNDPYGAIAQLVERFHGMEEVRSSILLSSTTKDEQLGPVSDWSLAGFVAGEGSFQVTRKLPPHADGDPRLRFVFAIAVAQRDLPILEALRTRLGHGGIRTDPPRKAHWQPMSRLTISSVRAHRTAVIPFMDAHLPPSAKRRQFTLWCRAMDAYERDHPNRWGKGPATCSVEGCARPVRGRGLCRSHYHDATGH